jgi:hypothetical protein
VVASLPILRKMVTMNQVAAAARRAGGSNAEAVARFMTLEGYGTGWSSVIVLAYEVLYIGTAAMLWVGLEWAAGDAGALPFDIIRIPDLAVPNFRPVWEVSYFSLAVILGASAVLTGRVFARISVSNRVPVFTSPVWQMGIAILAALVAPAGVLLYGVGVTWLQTAAVQSLSWPARLLHGEGYAAGVSDRLGAHVPVSSSSAEPSAGTTSAGAETTAGDIAATAASSESPASALSDTEGGGKERPIWANGNRTGGEAEDEAGEGGGGVSAADPAGTGPRQPSPSVITPLFDAAPLVDLASVGDDEFVVLGQNGELTLYHTGVALRTKRLRVARPLGLGPVPVRRVAFVDGGGRILDLSFHEEAYADHRGTDDAPVLHSGVIEEADLFAVSPLGTLVVTANSAGSTVSSLFLTSEIKRCLIDDVDAPTALGFSLDGRLLAVGTRTGDVRVVDVSGRGTASVLPGDRAGGRAVVAVAGTLGDDWVVAHDDERVALWAGGERVRSVDAGAAITCLAVNAADGRVAVSARPSGWCGG